MVGRRSLGGPAGAGVAAVLCPQSLALRQVYEQHTSWLHRTALPVRIEATASGKTGFCVMSQTMCRASRDTGGRVSWRGIWSATTSTARGWECGWQPLQDKCRRHKRCSAALQPIAAMLRCCSATQFACRPSVLLPCTRHQGPEVTADVVRSTGEKIQIVFLRHEAISQAGTGR